MNFIATSRDKEHDLQNKRRLLDVVVEKKADFIQLAEQFYEQPQRTDATSLRFAKQIVSTVDDILAAGNWEDSLFLRNTAKPMRRVRKDALELIEQLNEDSGHIELDEKHPGPDEQAVYVSIFQSMGYDLDSWAMQLRSINKHVLGRPVYENEEAVKKAIRAKLAQTSEAYVVVAIKKTAIQSAAQQAQREDRYGSQLLNLVENSVFSENILEFVHQAKRYHFYDGRLILK